MAIKELAYSVQQHIQASTGSTVRRAHVYELLAAAFGFKSFAAFSVDALLTDAGVVAFPPSASPELIGRVMQLGYPQAISVAIAKSLTDYAGARQVSFIRLRDLLAALTAQERLEDGDDDDEDWENDLDDDQDPGAVAISVEQKASAFLTSSVLMEGLEHAAAANNAEAHFAIAALYRCGRPNSYLHEESLKGRILNSVEQDWVDAYLQKKPRFEKYKHHLRQAATGGVRQAAAEFAEVFDDPEFYALAERGTGPIDVARMVKVATSLNNDESRLRWLRVAREEGSLDAIRTLARDGDELALRKLAETGDVGAIRELAEKVMKTDPGEARMWQHLAKMLGTDLTKSTMRAYHDGGPQDGQEYDDDFGGALYADGNEGLEMPSVNAVQDLESRKLAHAIFNRIQPDA